MLRSVRLDAVGGSAGFSRLGRLGLSLGSFPELLGYFVLGICVG